MKKSEKKNLLIGSIFLAMFAVWTALIQSVDVQPLGQNGTSIGFATFNCWFHHFTGVNMAIYTITDWMGLVPVVICLIFAGIGLVQLIKRRSLFRVDADIMILGVYFVIVFLAYAILNDPNQLQTDFNRRNYGGFLSVLNYLVGIKCNACLDRANPA